MNCKGVKLGCTVSLLHTQTCCLVLQYAFKRWGEGRRCISRNRSLCSKFCTEDHGKPSSLPTSQHKTSTTFQSAWFNEFECLLLVRVFCLFTLIQCVCDGKAWSWTETFYFVKLSSLKYFGSKWKYPLKQQNMGKPTLAQQYRTCSHFMENASSFLIHAF